MRVDDLMSMTSTSEQRSKFYHPYSPYKIQLDFMESLYDVLENGYKIGIFESPTGTGKTLSLICATMTWLREQKAKGDDSVVDDDSDDDPDWVKESFFKMTNTKRHDAGVAYEKHLDELHKSSRPKVLKEHTFPKRKKLKSVTVELDKEQDDQFLLDDYHSDDESSAITQLDRNSELALEIKSLMKKINGVKRDDGDLLDQATKIIFSSRTHSQLNQFSSQLSLPKFPSTYPDHSERLKYLPLGSRKQLCINDEVSKIKDITLLNETCLELHKPDATKKCPFYPSSKNEDLQELSFEFRDSLFAEVHDIEDLPQMGEKLHICPYYSVRKGIGYSEVMTLPYQLLLSKNSRDALGISVKGAIVVIDEAHNLLDTITSMNSVSVMVQEFELCVESLKKYLSRFTRRLNGGNRINLMKLIKIMNLILKSVNSTEKITPGKPIEVTDMLQGTTGDLLNIHKLDKYFTVSKLPYKLESYMSKEDRHRTPILFKIVEFLKAMSNPSREGKFFYDVKANGVSLNYMLLDPSDAFKDIVLESKCVILAGGTMEPTEDYYNYLFPYIDTQRIKKFTCGHIIPKENLEVFLVEGSEGYDFEFSFEKRNDTKMIVELGKSILGLIEKIPAGVVLFLPSYKYLSQVIETWKKSGIYDSIDKLKKVYTESSSSNVLDDYSTTVSSGKGALLLSVVGGRLSEGINFSDNLARAVMLIGLPYPNAFSGEIISKRKFIEDQVMERTNDKRQAMEATRDFYENICMRAVNQSVGRSIRHRHDYATIYLFDKRYLKTSIQSKLSDWIKQRVSHQMSLKEIIRATDSFFRNKK